MGLPRGHVAVAMMTCHPLQLGPTLFPPIGYAAEHGAQGSKQCNKQRAQMFALLLSLANGLETVKAGGYSSMQPNVC